MTVHDCGRPMNPKLIESQVRGGVLMGLSYALLEGRILDRHTGRMLNVWPLQPRGLSRQIP